jgi:hypothetical protein
MAIHRRNPVNDGVVFWIRAVADDLAVKILSDTPAGDVLYGHHQASARCRLNTRTIWDCCRGNNISAQQFGARSLVL